MPGSAAHVAFEWRQATIVGSGTVTLYSTLEDGWSRLTDGSGAPLPPVPGGPWLELPFQFSKQPSGVIDGDQFLVQFSNVGAYLIEVVAAVPFDAFSLLSRMREQ